MEQIKHKSDFGVNLPEFWFWFILFEEEHHFHELFKKLNFQLRISRSQITLIFWTRVESRRITFCLQTKKFPYTKLNFIIRFFANRKFKLLSNGILERRHTRTITNNNFSDRYILMVIFTKDLTLQVRI